MSTGETPATFRIYMESWLPFTFIWHDVLSTSSAFPRGTEFELRSSHFMWLADLCAWTQTVLKHVSTASSSVSPHYAVSREYTKIQHGSAKALLLQSTALMPKSLHGSAFLCPAGENVQPPVTQYCAWNKGSALTITGLQTFPGNPGLVLFWDRVFLIKVRRWSHDQNRMASYFEVCHGHSVWGHLYM